MINQEMRTLNVRRIDVCDIHTAITSVIIRMRVEMRDEHTTEAQRERLMKSINKWETLAAEVVRQLDEQDI